MMTALGAWAHHTVRGIVLDAADGEPMAFASVGVMPGAQSLHTDADGTFAFRGDAGRYTVKIAFIGYQTISQQITVTSDTTITFKLQPTAEMLREVVVTARESTGATSASRIDRDAMEHIQPTSFTDLLELLPGNISQNPNMGAVNSIALRETGNLSASGAVTNNSDYAMSSLGTLFVVDGVNLSGDAEMQNIPTSSTDGPEYTRNLTNRGVDMRTISTDNIESVEIVRGIPSAEYGNLTSGMVNIKRIKRATPLRARFKADEYSKLFSVGKGFVVGDHVVNVDGGYLDSKVDPRNNLENYKRINLSARANMHFNTDALAVTFAPGLDYTGSFDNSKVDPDLNYNKIDEYKSSYNKYAFSSELNVAFNKIKWLNAVTLNAGATYQADKLTRRKQVAPRRASVAPTTMDEGVHDGVYLLSEYIANYVSDGKPFDLSLKLKADGQAGVGDVLNKYKVGGEFTLAKNYGDGQVYDLSQPLSASWTTRPRAYKDIPALSVLSFFAEDNFSAKVGGSNAELQVGLRTMQLPSLDSRYALSGKVYLDPRANAVWHFPAVGRLKLLAAAGFGLTTKMPTIDYLYPQVHYNDIVQLNYYDVNNPTEYSRVNLRTYIEDATNYELKAARNRKWEVRIGAELGGNSLSVTYFDERMSSGYRYSKVYASYAYRKYDASAIDALSLTAQPSLDVLPYEDTNILDGYSRVTNGSRIDKRGVEFQLNTQRFMPLRTSLTVTGAWFKSRYSNSQKLYNTVNDVVGNQAVSDLYVGLYDTNDGRVNEQFNTNFMFDTQVPRWGLIFSTNVQCMWFVKTTRLRENGVPVQYIAASDGLLHDYATDALTNPLLGYLVKTYNEDVYRTQKVPTALYVNLKATKQIGKCLKISAFANRILDYLPDYQSNGVTVRRSSDAYFGMELNFTL
jgi:outer membrane cobalamin receptor